MSKSPRQSRDNPSLHGVAFIAENSAIRIVATARSDLLKGRMGLYAERAAEAVGNPDRHVSLDVVGLIEAPSAKCATSLVGALSQFWRARGRVIEPGVHGPTRLSLADVKASLKLVSKAYGFKAHHMNDVMQKKPKKGGSAHLKDIVELCLVPDPMLSDAEFLHRKSKNPESERVGMVEANVNMCTRIGGLALLRTRQRQHQEAARRFKAMFEGGQIGAPKAIDPEAIRVDRSASSDGGLFEIGEHSRRAYVAMQTALGVGKTMFLERMLVHEVSVSAIARATYGNAGGAARVRVSEAFKSALDDLAVHFKLASRTPVPSVSAEAQKVFADQAGGDVQAA